MNSQFNYARGLFQFAPDAQELFNSWLTKLENSLISGVDDGIVVEHLSKYRSLMPSLALQSYLIRAANGGALGAGVALEDAQKAVFLCEYLETHARRVYSMHENRSIILAKVLFSKIQSRKVADGFTQREIYRKGWSGLDEKGTKEACEELVSMGFLLEERIPSTNKGGAPSYKYRLPPHVRKNEEC